MNRAVQAFVDSKLWFDLFSLPWTTLIVRTADNAALV
jgi:hypothetical protein